MFDWIALFMAGKRRHDRMKGDICIDPDDIAFCTADFFKEHRMPRPTARKPALLPDYAEMTLTSLAILLTQRRAQPAGARL